VSRRQQGRWAAKEQQADDQQQDEAPPEAEPAAAPQDQGDDMDAKLSQLKQLGELKDAGVLSEAEFEVQKDKILHP
jgi:hypothetical protein